MVRYDDNGLCTYLINHANSHTISFYDSSKSLLIISNKVTNEPILLLWDNRVTEEEYKSFEASNYESKVYQISCELADRINLPLVLIRYVDMKLMTSDTIVQFVSRDPDTEISEKYIRDNIEEQKIKYLVDYITSKGQKAELINKIPKKTQNDKLSSAFHIWQRTCMKVGIFTDIDLIRIVDNKIQGIIELKRSINQLKYWKPYSADFFNYVMLMKFCDKAGIGLNIVFNHQISEKQFNQIPNSPIKTDYYYKVIKNNGEVVYDDISNLKIFELYHSTGLYNKCNVIPYPIGEETIGDFIDNTKSLTVNRKDMSNYWENK